MEDQEWRVVSSYVICIAQITATRPIVLLYFLNIQNEEWWNIISSWLCYCCFHWAYLNADSEMDFNSWKVSPPIRKKKTHSLLMKMWLNFYTYVYSWQSCWVTWVEHNLSASLNNLMNNRALQTSRHSDSGALNFYPCSAH